MAGGSYNKAQRFFGIASVLCIILLFVLSALLVWRITQIREHKELRSEIAQLRESLQQKAAGDVEMRLLNDLLKENERGLMNLRRNLRNLWEYEDVEVLDTGDLPEANTPIQSYQPSEQLQDAYYVNYNTEPVVDNFQDGERVDQNFSDEIQRPSGDSTRFVSTPLNESSRDFRDIQTVSATSQPFARGLGSTRQSIRRSETTSFKEASRGFGRGLGSTRNRTLARNGSRSFPSVPINQSSRDFRDTQRFNEVQYAEKIDYIPNGEGSFSQEVDRQLSQQSSNISFSQAVFVRESEERIDSVQLERWEAYQEYLQQNSN